ncbi:ComEA family DNA-binding protein [Catellatospora sp. IY07-71]|uniref:ComEA family DNA-binding protein n=1 Tax=Catellatospora sp. IY07-71 TaxID=2728827 RepID=UPI001BB35C6B
MPEPCPGSAPGSVFSRSVGSGPVENAADPAPRSVFSRSVGSGRVENAADPAPPSALPGRGAFDPGRRGLRALAAVAALVVALAAYLAWQARPARDPVPEPAVVVPDAPRPSAQASPQALVVAVTGRVRKPGLVRLPPGSRVADAIEAAGGVLPGTDLSTVNLARKVTDGELIAVAVPGLPAAGAPGGDGGPATGGLVNLNTATLAQLDALPGVGPVLAQRILDHRARHGEFRTIGDLRQVEGIGESKFAQLKDLVTV